MSKPIQVFEHDKLTIHNGLNKSMLAKLYQFNDSNNNKYFTGVRDGVKFTEYVGVIQIGGQTIEILPKADKNLNANKELWQKVLLQMLSVCKEVSIETVSDAMLNRRNHSILDLYFERYLHELEKLLHKGLVKKYRMNVGNVKSLKGQLQFAQNLQKNLVHKERFFTKHQIYDTEHLINQILLKALNILAGMISNPLLLSRVKKIQFSFPEIKEIHIQEAHFNQILITRKTQDYKEALQIARMIILNYSPDLSGGNENMIALLFNMNNLWEEYIYRMLLKANKLEYKIQAQGKQDFWEKKTIRPDIIVKKGDSTFIIDTKWKVINNDKPSDDDLKQIYTYNQYWDSSHSLLVYPNVGNINENKWGKYHIGKNGGSYCKLYFVDVLSNEKRLNEKVGEEILGNFDFFDK